MLVSEILIYGLALWLGLYLIGRDVANPRLRFAGLGLIAFALGLANDVLATQAPTPSIGLSLMRMGAPLLFLPGLFWFSAALHLLAEGSAFRERLVQIWKYGWLAAAASLYALGVGSDLVFDITAGAFQIRPGYFLFSALVLFPLLLALFFMGRVLSTTRMKAPVGVLLVGTIFLTLSTGLLVSPFGWLPRAWAVSLIGVDLLLLGVAIAGFDAFDQGEALLPDLIRSLDFSFFTVLLFAGQVALAIIVATGLTFSMLVLLLSTMAAAIAVQTLSDPVQTALDRLAFAGSPRLRKSRSDLRAAASALPRLDESLDLQALEDEEFMRVTRYALSHFGNLPRLAASPLTRLPLVEARLAEHGSSGNTLERAAALKAILADSIERLKPRNQDDFGTSDEWRYYNALYFPYVVGLKPYSRRAVHDGLDTVAREALEWLRTYVPERTLHNWQNTAAELVAQDLRERSKEVMGAR